MGSTFIRLNSKRNYTDFLLGLQFRQPYLLDETADHFVMFPWKAVQLRDNFEVTEISLQDYFRSLTIISLIVPDLHHY